MPKDKTAPKKTAKKRYMSDKPAKAAKEPKMIGGRPNVMGKATFV